MSDFREILTQTKRQIKEVSVQEVRDKLNPENGFTLLDVREGDEWEQGHLDKAIFLPRGFLEIKADKVLTDKSQPIVIYCAGGVRSALAAKSLQELGYSNVCSMRGGFTEWKNNGLPFVTPEKVGKDKMARYSRHLRIPEVGEAGQLKLLKSKVLLVGAGGLGSPAGVYLAACGVGTIGLVDYDVVDESNLQRQILHWTSSVGILKVDSARRTLFEVNPDVKVKTYPIHMDASNILDIMGEYDVIVSGSDNFTTAYMVNDAAVLLKKPVVYGSILRFDGQASTFIPYQGPCYRCVFPEATPTELAPSCDEAGVLGVLPGLVGLIQATEVIKLLLNIGTTLCGHLLLYDALEMSFRKFKLRRDPACTTCGPNAHIDLSAIPEFVCSVQATSARG
jgi:molybdopterin/thiamine biosynthesis adenylyltransferase/rhodanese-related sulfurtransferase